MDLRMLAEKHINLLGLMRREVVGNDMNLLASGLVGHDVSQEGHKLGRGVTRGGLAEYFAGLGIEGGVQRERTVPDIFEPMTLSAPRRQRQHGVFAIERLNRRLLVDAEYGRMLRWIEIQPDHVGGLGLEVRVVGGKISLQPMGFVRKGMSSRATDATMHF